LQDVIVIGGGFAGVTAARESALRGAETLLLEARDRLGGRTWTAPWDDREIELGGGWVHWHQPFTWSEIVKAELSVSVSDTAEQTGWYVDGVRHEGTAEERDAIADRGWRAFVDGVDAALPEPHDPLTRIERLSGFDRLTIAQRVDQLDLTGEERAVLWAELESLAPGPLTEAGAVSVLRWHGLSGYSLELTQFTGGRVTLDAGTRGLLEAIASGADFQTRLATPVAAVRQTAGAVEVETRGGERVEARAVIVAVPLNVVGAIEFDPPLSAGKRNAVALGQASRGIKIFIRANGPERHQNSIRPGHPFGYLATEWLDGGGDQVLIGFGMDAEACDPGDLDAVQRQLDDIVPGYQVRDATAHDWLADEFAQGTWAIHRPGWYTTFHAEMRRPENRVVLAGSDIANGWSGFIDGAIESGFRGSRLALERARA
jgi:monoamine oxidase